MPEQLYLTGVYILEIFFPLEVNLNNLNQGCTTQISWWAKFFLTNPSAKVDMFWHLQSVFLSKKEVQNKQNLGFRGPD